MQLDWWSRSRERLGTVLVLVELASTKPSLPWSRLEFKPVGLPQAHPVRASSLPLARPAGGHHRPLPMKSLGLVGRAQGRQRSPAPVCARYSHVFLLATIPCTGPFLPAPSDHYSAYLCLRQRKGPASRCRRPEANVPLTTSYLFFLGG